MNNREETLQEIWSLTNRMNELQEEFTPDFSNQDKLAVFFFKGKDTVAKEWLDSGFGEAAPSLITDLIKIGLMTREGNPTISELVESSYHDCGLTCTSHMVEMEKLKFKRAGLVMSLVERESGEDSGEEFSY